MAQFNYNHLRYFWAVAHEGNLTRTAERLHVSQSALSTQIQKLETQLGHKLFERQGRNLKLTEAGRIALDYADVVFKTGDELLGTLRGQGGSSRQVLRVGAITTLSRNFQLALLQPLIGRHDVQLVVRSGTMRELLTQLEAHTIDLVLSNQSLPRDTATPWQSHLLQQQAVSLVGRPKARSRKMRFPEDLADTPVILPSLDSDIRVAFDQILERAGIRPIIVAEVDDMAMLRLFARESGELTLVPPVVVRDELKNGLLVERCQIPDLSESFYAITQSRRFANPLVKELMATPLSRSGF
ncbi:MAG: LysR family transcriptional regulator [Rhizobiales bacterium]|nr:LysR family transcriptional regulator [Hyphomicrobiales bacterium]